MLKCPNCFSDNIRKTSMKVQARKKHREPQFICLECRKKNPASQMIYCQKEKNPKSNVVNETFIYSRKPYRLR